MSGAAGGYAGRGSPLESARVVSPAPRDAWWEVLRADSEALPFLSPDWLDCICAAGPYEDASRLYELPGGRRLVLPLVRRRGLPRRLAPETSMPHGWGSVGLVAEGGAGTSDVAAVFRDLARRPSLQVSIRPNPRGGDVWAAAPTPGALAIPRLAHVLDLAGGPERIWAESLKSAAQRAVRKAERSGLVVECDASGRLIPVFHELATRWADERARDQHLPALLVRWRARRREPLRKLQLVAARLGEACRTWVAWLDGRPAAAIVLLIRGGAAVYWRNVSDRDLANPTRANNLLMWRVIEDACRAGCSYLEMGESGGVDSLMRYKESFGAVRQPFAEYYLERLPITPAQQRVGELVGRVEQLVMRRRGGADAEA